MVFVIFIKIDLSNNFKNIFYTRIYMYIFEIYFHYQETNKHTQIFSSTPPYYAEMLKSQ